MLVRHIYGNLPVTITLGMSFERGWSNTYPWPLGPLRGDLTSGRIKRSEPMRLLQALRMKEVSVSAR